MRHGRTDARHDALTDTRQYGVLAGTTHELVDVGTHRYAGLGNELDTVLGHGCHRRSVDYLRVDRSLHSLKHVATCEVDGCGLFERKVDIGFRSTDQRVHHSLHMTTSHIVGFKIVACDVAEAGLVGLNQGRHNDARGHIANTHQKELDERNVYARNFGREPEKERHKVEKDGEQNDECHHHSH